MEQEEPVLILEHKKLYYRRLWQIIRLLLQSLCDQYTYPAVVAV